MHFILVSFVIKRSSMSVQSSSAVARFCKNRNSRLTFCAAQLRHTVHTHPLLSNVSLRFIIGETTRAPFCTTLSSSDDSPKSAYSVRISLVRIFIRPISVNPRVDRFARILSLHFIFKKFRSIVTHTLRIPREITSKSPIVLQEFKKKGIGIIIGRIWSTRRGIKILGSAKGRAFKKRAALRCFIRFDKEATWRNKHTATLITREQSVLTR